MMFFGCPARPVQRGVWDEIQRIGGACVLRLRGVIEIANSGFWVEHDVFDHRAKTMRSRVNLRLGLGGQLDALGVAAALKVEHPVWPPAMLIVADEHAVRIGRERGFAGAGEAEEQRDVAVLADIGRAMHRHHALCRQIEIERGED